MQDYQREFIQFAIENGVLRFGEFKLKSGRLSPYFFNTGEFSSGVGLARLGQFYARAIVAQKMMPDVLYGPAYKGIPLVCSVAIALAEKDNIDLPFVFNRKEAKDHGEGGVLVGSGLKGDVLILDDVITAGTSVRESIALIEGANANPAGVMIALDRQERGLDERYAIAELSQKYDLKIASIIGLVHIIEYLAEQGDRASELANIEAYQKEYGV
jgi:orotate phosphoribosyltransferase